MSQAGVLNIESSHPQIATQYDADSGSAVPVGNVLNIVGTGAVTTSASGNTVTISSSAGSVDSVSGTADRITISGTAADPVVDIASTYVGQASITTLGTIATGTWNADAIGEVYGGTGQSTYTTGDILYASASNTLSKLPVGSNGEVLTLAAGIPSWTAASGGDISGPVSSTDNAIVRWDGTGGDTVQDSNVTIDNSDNVDGVNSLTIDPASGDSYTQYSIGGTGEFRIGVDDDDGDSWKISQGSALGTNDTFKVASSGEITMPLQPAFMAQLAAARTNVTGDGTTYTIVWGTETLDQGSDWDNTSTFTAPVTASYQFNLAVLYADVSGSNGAGNIGVVTSNRTYTNCQSNSANLQVSGQFSLSTSVLADMDATDTATSRGRVASGTKIVDIGSGGATDPRSTFSGWLAV